MNWGGLKAVSVSHSSGTAGGSVYLVLDIMIYPKLDCLLFHFRPVDGAVSYKQSHVFGDCGGFIFS